MPTVLSRLRLHTPVALTLTVLSLSLQGCATAPGSSVSDKGLCDDSKLGWIVGLEGNEENMRRAARESGAGLTDPIGPASIVSKDLRRDRLRVYLDKNNIVTAARCE